MYIHTNHVLKIKQGYAYTHDKNNQTQKRASGSTNFVEEITVSINNISIDKHDVLRKLNIPNKLMLKIKIGNNIQHLPAGFLIAVNNALKLFSNLMHFD